MIFCDKQLFFIFLDSIYSWLKSYKTSTHFPLVPTCIPLSLQRNVLSVERDKNSETEIIAKSE